MALSIKGLFMKITICGDFVPIARGIKTVNNRTALSNEVVSIIKESDYSIVNLEAPVASSGELCIPKNGPHLHIPADTVSYLKECGVDAVTLANNHFYDYGDDGIIHTIDACKDNRIDYVGGGLDLKERSKILFVKRDKVTVAILNYCESEFSVQEVNGSNPINPINVFYDIREAKTKSDKIIVITHGGHEGYNLPSPRMKQLFRYFIDLGANVVCNHHQHCYSGFEEYNGGVIFYGLGNFFFDDFRAERNRSSRWNTGYIVSLEISNNDLAYKIIPYEQCKSDAIVCLLNTDQSREFDSNIENINNVISDDAKLKNSFDCWCDKQKKVMLTWFSPYSNRLLMALCRRGLLPKFISSTKRIQLYNSIRCESHRDVILNNLRVQ